MFACALYKCFYYPQIWFCKQHLLSDSSYFERGCGLRRLPELYTVFAVIQAPPQYKSHSILNLIFNALY